ncbi:PH domain-containing protein [Photobacterium sanguinicancri]|uniref:PH domain-containing protein n=1 Tax=Photobacterium sanguinicancri TaxID=875932 RepID=UPI002480A8AD|nr:PH domain-containing protein [Photobacterium sanguinicancri]
MAKELKHVTKFKENHLNSGESVIAWGEGYIGEMMGKGDKTQHNGALLVTEHRVAFYRKGFIGEVLETIPLKNITSIERKSALGHRTIRVHTSHDDLEFKTFSKEQEQDLISAIESGRETTDEKSTVTTSTESNIDKIKKLAELKDAGILTEQEFEDKKAQLLSDI